MEGIKVAEWLDSGKSQANDHASVNRREKRTVPSSEKDAKYWEKRHRNNLAAKRSRENKRLVEMSTKKKATILERENALLRHEIQVLKTKFGLPLNQSFLTEHEQAEFQKDWKMHETSMDEQDVESVCSEEESRSPYPVTLVQNHATSQRKQGVVHTSDSDNSGSGSSNNGYMERDDKSLQSNMPFYGMLWASAMAGYVERGNQDTINKTMSHLPPSSMNIHTHPSLQYLPYGVSQQQSLSPTDLSTKKSQSRQQVQNDMHPYTRKESTVDENSEVKMKLMQLSAQLDEMKKMFIKKE